MIRLRESIAQSLTQQGASFTDDLEPPSWWEQQLIPKGEQGRIIFLFGLFGIILLPNIIVVTHAGFEWGSHKDVLDWT